MGEIQDYRLHIDVKSHQQNPLSVFLDSHSSLSGVLLQRQKPSLTSGQRAVLARDGQKSSFCFTAHFGSSGPSASSYPLNCMT